MAYTLDNTAVRAPLPASSAAYSPAPPAPTTTTSKSCINVFLLTQMLSLFLQSIKNSSPAYREPPAMSTFQAIGGDCPRGHWRVLVIALGEAQPERSCCLSPKGEFTAGWRSEP